MIRQLLERMSRINQGYGSFIERVSSVETLGALMFMLAIACSLWVFAWNAHIIGPWIDNLMGWGPHDIDSAGKIRWRRIWSTAICLPGIIASLGLYLRNRKR
jgi:hypothetical protein